MLQGVCSAGNEERADPSVKCLPPPPPFEATRKKGREKRAGRKEGRKKKKEGRKNRTDQFMI